MQAYLRATETIESGHPAVRARAERLCAGCDSDRERVVRLFAFVRDSVRYNIYMISMFPEDFRASFILETGKGYCVQKAVLLCALGRAMGIPSRIALARIKNHRTPAKLRARLGTDTFPAHGYNQFFLDGGWVSAAATFDRFLCEKAGVPVVEFDGRNDAMLPARALDDAPYIEYLEHFGTYRDLPLDWIVARTSRIWGRDKRAWLRPGDDPGHQKKSAG